MVTEADETAAAEGSASSAKRQRTDAMLPESAQTEPISRSTNPSASEIDPAIPLDPAMSLQPLTDLPAPTPSAIAQTIPTTRPSAPVPSDDPSVASTVLHESSNSPLSHLREGLRFTRQKVWGADLNLDGSI